MLSTGADLKGCVRLFIKIDYKDDIINIIIEHGFDIEYINWN